MSDTVRIVQVLGDWNLSDGGYREVPQDDGGSAELASAMRNLGRAKIAFEVPAQWWAEWKQLHARWREMEAELKTFPELRVDVRAHLVRVTGDDAEKTELFVAPLEGG